MARRDSPPASPSTSDDDEEEDRRTLVPQNDAPDSKPLPRRRSSSFSSSPAFEIAAALPARLGRRLWSGKTYLFAFSLPAVLVLLFFSLDLGRLFRGGSFIPVASTRAAAGGDWMREAELRALYLLKNQQSELLRLWNLTLSAGAAADVAPLPPVFSTNSTSASNSTSPVRADRPKAPIASSTLDELRSALIRQIKLNKEIQGALLSSHRFGNLSAESSDENVGFDLPGSAAGVCSKVNRPGDRKTIEWKPKKNRFLLAICLSGQMSNHLICLEKHMFFAALLDRVLVLPSSKVDYQYDRVLDINHINDCFGRKVVMSFDEFMEVKKNKVKIDRFICYIASPPCFLDDEHIKRLKNLGLSLGKIEAAWPEDAKLKTQKKRVVGDIMPKFSSNDEVIAIGDMFYADVEEEWVMQPGGPLSHKCKTVIQPSRLIYLTAQRFVQTFLGNNFIALHFRRHGFLKFCNEKKESCFFPIPQAAECILRAVEKANAPIIYLSTDAAESETNLLQSMVVLGDKKIPLVKRPSHIGAEKWDALLYRNRLGGDSQVEAMLDKTICAMSSVFIGASGSTFTEDIIRLRRGWESASQCDEYLCQGELPNFIAGNE